VRGQSANRSYSPQYVSSSLWSRRSARSTANPFQSSLPDCRNGTHPMPQTGSRRALWTAMPVQRSVMGGKPEKICSVRGLPAMTQMYGAAVRCKRFRRSVGLRSCINVSGLWLERVVLRATMDISAHAFSLADRPLGFSCAVKTDPPYRLLLSQTSAGIGRVLGQCCLLVAAVPFFVPERPILRPGRQSCRAARAGAVKTGRLWRPPAGLGFDGSEHGATLI
jgi:hypothetical protein